MLVSSIEKGEEYDQSIERHNARKHSEPKRGKAMRRKKYM
jgi:hypothetical protein